jgi:hypothetical protein
MADISDVRISEIKEISDNLEALSCKFYNNPAALPLHFPQTVPKDELSDCS